MSDAKTVGLEGPSPSQNTPGNKADREGSEVAVTSGVADDGLLGRDRVTDGRLVTLKWRMITAFRQRIPTLPESHCAGCPCSHAINGVDWCTADWTDMLPYTLRTAQCISHEVAWRNVALGLATVAWLEAERVRYEGPSHD